MVNTMACINEDQNTLRVITIEQVNQKFWLFIIRWVVGILFYLVCDSHIGIDLDFFGVVHMLISQFHYPKGEGC